NREMGAFLYGRRVWEVMASFWPTADEDPAATRGTIEYARLWRPMPKVIFSRSLETTEWNSRVVNDDIPGAVSRLKAETDKDVALFGGAEIAWEFMRLGLIDEYQLFVHPVVLGG